MLLEDYLSPIRLLLAKAKGPGLLLCSYFPSAPTTDPSFLGMTSKRRKGGREHECFRRQVSLDLVLPFSQGCP
jgi:hypothetical protein